MGAAWFAILALMLTTYAVLDGYDFGVGILHLFVARTDAERRRVFAAIEPVWDGNEVWIVGAGGALVFAFPRVYAAAFSGLYLPLMMVLWLLILRGVAIKVRSQLSDPLWRTGWDTVFAFASASMAIVLGVTIGNLVRGVPLDASGYFEEDLFSLANGDAGALNVYTALLGAFGLATLGAHGATYLALKTDGQVHARARALGSRLWIATLTLAAIATAVTALTQPAFFARARATVDLATADLRPRLRGALTPLAFPRARTSRVPRFVRVHRSVSRGDGLHALSDDAPLDGRRVVYARGRRCDDPRARRRGTRLGPRRHVDGRVSELRPEDVPRKGRRAPARLGEELSAATRGRPPVRAGRTRTPTSLFSPLRRRSRSFSAPLVPSPSSAPILACVGSAMSRTRGTLRL